jgi:hypothetical protein
MPRSASKTLTRPTEVPDLEARRSEFKNGDRVSHPKFGNGVVTAIDADKLTIRFARNVVKQVVDYYVKRRA